MAYTERFKQIEPFVGKMQRAPHAAHLSWMQRFQERVGTLIVTELGQDCPAMIVSQNTALVAAVQAEDEAYRTITRSPLCAPWWRRWAAWARLRRRRRHPACCRPCATIR